MQRKLYQAIGAGLIGLPLVLGGCVQQEESDPRYQNPKHIETKIEPEIVDKETSGKLETIIKEVHKRLSQAEMPHSDYRNFLHNQFRDSKLPHTNYGRNTVLIEDRLDIKVVRGFSSDYVIISSTNISEAAKQDIAAYNNLEKELYAALKKEIGKKSTLYEEFYNFVSKYVEQKSLGQIDPRRLYILVVDLVIKYESQFDVKTQRDSGSLKPNSYINRVLNFLGYKSVPKR